MKSDKPRRTRASKQGLGRNPRLPGVGKGRLRAAKRERKLSARTDLLQISKSAERGAETAAPAVSEGRRAKNDFEKTAAQETAPRDRAAAAEEAKDATELSGSTGSHPGHNEPKGASAKASGRPSRRRTAKADAAKADVATQPAATEAASAAATPGRSRRRRAGDAAQPRRGGKAVAFARSTRKSALAEGATRAATEPEGEAARETASPTRQRRKTTEARPAITRSVARSTELSAGLSPAGSTSQNNGTGKASRGGGGTPSGVAASTAGAGGAGSSPAESPSFGRAPDAFALAQEAAEIGAAALRNVATARSLPELVEAQLHCSRAASEIWVYQLRIAASIFLVPTDPWWPSPNAVAGSRRE